MTNGDYIRSMSDNELVKILDSCSYCSIHNAKDCDGKCQEHMMEWIKQEIKDGDQE